MEQNSNVEQLLACLVQVVGRATLPPNKVSEIVGQGRQLRAFNMCDGTHTQGEIVKKLRIDQGSLSRTFARWVENGVAFRIGDGKEVRLMHIYAIPATPGRRARTGPALEAYSQHPVVKKANNPGELMTVAEFLRHVRRIVVDFVVGRVLLGDATSEEVSGLDDVTSYYLLHRHDFGMDDAPAGACILYALSCGLSDRELSDQFDLLVRTGGKDAPEEDEEANDAEPDEDAQEGSGSKVKLKPWQQRKGRNLGDQGRGGRAAPLIDQVHRLMHLWKMGEVVKVNEYLDAGALRQNKIFHQLLQALIELAAHGSEERSLLEKISNHVAARGVAAQEELKL